MPCPRCVEQGRPEHFGSEPKCAFESGVFDGDNWQCATAIALRNAIDDLDAEYPRSAWKARNDNDAAAIGVLYFGDLPNTREYRGYIVLTWYKERGRTSGALVVCDGEHHALTLAEAEYALAFHADRLVEVTEGR